MPSIVSVATAVPSHRFAQAELRERARQHFAGRIDNLDRYLTVFDNALIDERYFAVPPDWHGAPRSFAERNATFLHEAKRLSVMAAAQCLERGNIAPEAVNHIIFVSSSGFSAPSLDVEIAAELGLSPNVMRIPVFGLGCAGGAAALRIGASLTRADPAATVLIIAVEINSITFQPDDDSKQNLVAVSLFADGAGAMVLRGDAAGSGPLEIGKSFVELVPASRDLMGWEVVDTGFKVVFSNRVPDVIGRLMPSVFGGLAIDGELDDFILHPGGRRILESYSRVLDRPAAAFRSSYEVLRRYGNMSSATVLFVLDDRLRHSPGPSGANSLLAAFGPGFSAEATLLRWR